MTSTESPTPEILAGRYRVERVLGRGGFGVMYAATELDGGRPVAIKQLDLRNVDEWKSVELFEREAEVLSRLDHPLVPAYVEFVPIAEAHAGLLVQQLAPGRSLQAHLDDGRKFSEQEIRSIAVQVLDVLIYLGGLDPAVVHRDIKPANLVLDDEGTARLVDFGAVKEAAGRASTVSRTVAGTFGFMAPEQIQGGAEPRSDLYSLGMTMIALLTGESPSDLPRKRLKPIFLGAADVSTTVGRFIDRLVEPVPDDRFASAQAAKEALEDASASATLAEPTADIGALVEARDVAHRQATRKKKRLKSAERARQAVKLARRKDRVRVACDEERTRVTVAPKFMFDKLSEQLVWGVMFTFINPGVFIVLGLWAILGPLIGFGTGAAISLAIALWTALLGLGNLVYAAATRRAIRIDISKTGHFALYVQGAAKPTLLGTTGQLRADVDKPRKSRLGTARFRDEHGEVQVDRLSPRDLETLRNGLSKAGVRLH